MTGLMPDMNKVTTADTDTLDLPPKTTLETPCYLAETVEICGHNVPTAQKPRQLLALLLTEAGRSVNILRMIEELWEANPPRSAQSTIQTYVLKVRKCFGDAGKEILATTPRGYCLQVVSPSLVDVLHFKEVVGGIQTGGDHLKEPLAKITALDSAFQLIRGPVLDDINCGPVLRNWLQSFNELQRGALRTWTEAALRLRWYQKVIDRILPYSLGNPDIEDFVRWLMLALYCSNRRSRALELYRQFRKTEIEAQGVEPGFHIQKLHQMILTEDDGLRNPHHLI